MYRNMIVKGRPGMMHLKQPMYTPKLDNSQSAFVFVGCKIKFVAVVVAKVLVCSVVAIVVFINLVVVVVIVVVVVRVEVVVVLEAIQLF